MITPYPLSFGVFLVGILLTVSNKETLAHKEEVFILLGIALSASVASLAFDQPPRKIYKAIWPATLSYALTYLAGWCAVCLFIDSFSRTAAVVFSITSISFLIIMKATGYDKPNE